MDKIKELLEQMTLEEKIALCSGKDFWHTKDYPNYEIPSVMLCDGPHGLRKQENAADMLGINNSVPSTCFPTASLSACSFNPELLSEMGKALGEEASANEVRVVLGPGANLKRNPLCGRNFEYFSEDPYLTGKLAAAEIRGIESTGTKSSLKHFALNNQEYKRFSSDSLVDERTMRELYLAGFEIAVKEGKPSTVMCSYNKINGVHSSDNRELLTGILRDEWGFDGLVVTDWGAMSDRIKGFLAGCDLSMPGGSDYMEKECLAAVQNGTLSEADVDRSAERVLRLVFGKQEKKSVAMESHEALAKRIAAESMVLLKNEDELLPLSEEDTGEILFVGAMAETMRYQGAGSSHINPWRLCNVLENAPGVRYVKGCAEDGTTTPEMLEEIRQAAKQAKAVVVFAGLTDAYESEGFDRKHMNMPEGHLSMIEAALSQNQNIAVVLMCGAPIELPFADQVKAILFAGLSGEAGGAAIADLLFGRANPSGKLAETWAMKYEDCVSSSYYGAPVKNPQYREGIYVGYRYYQKAKVPVRFCFGHGLSYTAFSYEDLSVTETDDGFLVSCRVKNTGERSGSEVVQLYLAPEETGTYRAVRELKGFAKVTLQAGEEKTVTTKLDRRSFAIWQGRWVVPAGAYRIELDASVDDIRLSETVQIEGEKISFDVPEWYKNPTGAPGEADFKRLYGRELPAEELKKGSFTMENTPLEMKEHSLLMKIMVKAIEKTIAKGFDGKVDYNNPEFAMLLNSSADCSLSGMKINGGMKNCVLEGMLEMANGHFFKGLGKMIRRQYEVTSRL